MATRTTGERPTPTGTADALAPLRRRLPGARRRATTVALAPHGRQVGPTLAGGTRPGARYRGDGYRRAADYVLAHARGAGAGPTLVHGTGRAGRLRWGHAWVALPGGLVFDGVRQRFYEPAGYHCVLQTTAEATYRPAEVMAWLRATQRYGPWHRGALGAAPGRPRRPRRRGHAGAGGAGPAAPRRPGGSGAAGRRPAPPPRAAGSGGPTHERSDER